MLVYYSVRVLQCNYLMTIKFVFVLVVYLVVNYILYLLYILLQQVKGYYPNGFHPNAEL